MFDLSVQVAEHEKFGAHRMDRSLGIHRMPENFALMLDSDDLYFYWRYADGRYSTQDWNKWRVRRGAKLFAKSVES